MSNIPTTAEIKAKEGAEAKIEGNKMGVYAINDRKSGFQNLMLFKTDGGAIRAFAFACKNPQNDFAKFPVDYELCKIGTFDIDSGIITPQIPKEIALAYDHANKGENNEQKS